jgi:copper chaperone CopZ
VLAHTPGVCLVDLDISSATIVVEFDAQRVEEADIAALLSVPAAGPL